MRMIFTILSAGILFVANNLSAQWQNYPYSPANSYLTFQDDDGYHPAPNTSTEWWYINMTLTGSAPAYKNYSVMLCYFRFANMRIFNIASETDNTFINDVLQQPFFPVFNPQLGHWEFTYTKTPPNAINDYSRWTYPQDGKTYSYIYHAEDPVHNDGLDVTVVSNRPPLVVGGNGYIALGDKGDSSYYYSYSNMKVTGTLRYNGVTDSITSGIAWIDRQYGPFTVGVNSSNLYEWFSLQLDNPGAIKGIPESPSEFNIWQIFSDTNSVPYSAEWRLVTGIYPDDSQDTSSSYFFERTGYWYDYNEQKYYSQGWRFINPSKDVTVDLVPPVKDQLVDVVAFRFWEGGVNLKGIINDKAVDGVGFAEIVAGRNFPIAVPSVPGGLTAVKYNDRNNITWQASSSGTFPIGGYRIYRSSTNDGHWKYLASTTTLSYDDYPPSMDSTYFYTVTSFDNQTATSASDYAPAAIPFPLSANNDNRTDVKFDIFPNPASENVSIQFALISPGHIRIEIFDLPGRKVMTLANNYYSPGNHKIDFDAGSLSEGSYFVRANTDNFITIKKLFIGNVQKR